MDVQSLQEGHTLSPTTKEPFLFRISSSMERGAFLTGSLLRLAGFAVAKVPAVPEAV